MQELIELQKKVIDSQREIIKINDELLKKLTDQNERLWIVNKQQADLILMQEKRIEDQMQ